MDKTAFLNTLELLYRCPGYAGAVSVDFNDLGENLEAWSCITSLGLMLVDGNGDTHKIEQAFNLALNRDVHPDAQREAGKWCEKCPVKDKCHTYKTSCQNH